MNKISPEYANCCSKFVSGVTPILETISLFFPYYTSHDASHSINILNRYLDILKSDCFKRQSKIRLNKIELYLLICGAFSHDLGMAVFPGEEDEILGLLSIDKYDGWRTDKRLQQHLRANHSTRGFSYICKNEKALGVPTHLLDLLDKMMRAHNQNTEELKFDIIRNKYSASNEPLQLMQLACILCVADALEFSDTRVKDRVLTILEKKLSEDPDDAILLSYQENMKHESIGSNLAITSNGEIIISGSFKSADILNLAHKNFDDIEIWLRDYLEIDAHFSTPRISIRSHVIYRKLQYLGGDFERLGIRLKKENIIKLITSNAVWQHNQAAVIKELMQNSVEACRYRKYNSAPAEKYNPEILLEFNNLDHSIKLSDNGCGMAKDIILNNFLTVANSRSNNPNYLRGDYFSIARFGIGFWSVFSIASKAIVQTTNFEVQSDIGLKFEVSTDILKDFIVFEPIKKSPGTSIELIIRKDINLNEIQAKLSLHIQCSEIHIKIININATGKTEHFISPKVPILTEEVIFGHKLSTAIQSNVKLFHWQKEIEDFDFKMFISYKLNDKGVSFFLSDYGNYITIDDWHNKPIRTLFQSINGTHTTSICGFVVNRIFVYTVFQPEGIGGYVANIENPRGYSFNLNRMVLLPSKELANYALQLSRFLMRGYKKFLEETNSLNSEIVYRLNQESGRGISGGIESDKVQIINAMSEFPELFCYKLHRIEKGKTFTNCQIVYLNLNDLLQEDLQLVYYVRYHSRHNYLMPDTSKPEFIYDILHNTPEFEGCYLIDDNTESQTLFTKDKDSYVKNIKINFTNLAEVISLPIFSFNTKKITFEVDSFIKIGVLNSLTWAGIIYLKNVLGGNFVFSHNSVIIDPTTKLAHDVQIMYDNGDHSVLANLINMLALSEVGQLNDEIIEYLT